MKYLLTLVSLFVGSLALLGQSFTGSWKGDLNIQGVVLPFVIHIQQEGNVYKATADSPKQGAFGLPTKISVLNDSLDVYVEIGAKVRGKKVNDSTINTIFSQGGMQLPLILKKSSVVDKQGGLNRPQEPKPPYSYNEEDFIVVKDSMTTFTGTITSPKGIGKYPTVILISGSGQQNRDEELFGHKPFKVLADFLTRNGFVVLRYDDIGTGGSKGDLKHLTSYTQANDVNFLLNYLVEHLNVDVNRVGLIGHSEGGIIAPIVAKNNEHVKFIVSLAGMAIKGNDLLMRQMKDFNGWAGRSTLKREMYEQLMMIMREEKDDDIARENMHKIVNDYALNNTLDGQDSVRMNMFFSPWYLTFVKHDPALYLKELKIPFMALNGFKDVQVDARDNLSAFELYLPKHKKHVFKSYPNLNHLFQTAQTGGMFEYSILEETFHEPVMYEITDWIKSL